MIEVALVCASALAVSADQTYTVGVASSVGTQTVCPSGVSQFGVVFTLTGGVFSATKNPSISASVGETLTLTLAAGFGGHAVLITDSAGTNVNGGSYNGAAAGQAPASGVSTAGQSLTWTPTVAGTYHYVCVPPSARAAALRLLRRVWCGCACADRSMLRRVLLPASRNTGARTVSARPCVLARCALRQAADTSWAALVAVSSYRRPHLVCRCDTSCAGCFVCLY
jgi:plastocyanin